MKKFITEFKTFCTRGNLLELAVAVMVGGAFGAIVNSLVNDLVMPLIGLLTGGVNLAGLFVALNGQSYPTIEAAQAAGAGTFNYGAFLQALLNFLLVAFCVFLLVKLVSKLMPPKPVSTKEARKCPYCKEDVADEATRCPHCTSELAQE